MELTFLAVFSVKKDVLIVYTQQVNMLTLR